MRIISRSTLTTFWKSGYGNSKIALEVWYNEAKEAEWESPADIKRDYPSASFLTGNRVVFNIKGNTYRLIVKINYSYRIIYIRFISTHAEYNKIDVENV